MKAKINEILKDLYELSPELNKKELNNIVQKLILLRPDARMDKKFKDELRKELLCRFVEKVDEKKTIFQGVLEWVMGRKLKIALAGVAACCILAVVFFYRIFYPGIQKYTVLSSEKEILEIDLSKTKRLRIMGVNFDLENCVFVDKNGNTAKNKIKIKFKNFNNPDSVISSKHDLVYMENNRKLPFVSGGMFDLNIYNKKNKLNIKKGSYIKIDYPVSKVLNEDDAGKMKIYSVDEKTGLWKYESRPVIVKLDNKEYYKFKVTHLSYWNIDYPLYTHACIKGRVTFENGREVSDNSVRIVAIGKSYMGRTGTFAIKAGYEVDVRKASEIKIIAVSGDNRAGILDNVSIGPRQGRAGILESSRNYKYEMQDIVLTKEKLFELSKRYDLKGIHSKSRIFIMQETPLRIRQLEPVRERQLKALIIFSGEVIEKVFFQALVDGVEQEGKIYFPGDKIRIEAKKVMQLKIGNAGSIDVTINGQPENLGKSGEIANKIIQWERDPYDESVYHLIIKDWQ